MLLEERFTSGQPVQTLWPLADHLGTARVILDGADLVLSRLTYDSFGNLVNVPAIVPTFTFTGRDYDNASGLYNYRARWYDARNGIFVSNDPIGFAAGDTNLSRYVHNMPTSATDPSGLESVFDGFWAAGRTLLTIASGPFGFAARAFYNADGISADLDLLTGGFSTRMLASRSTGMVVDAVDQSVAGFAHSITLGGSTRLRSEIWGETASRNHEGAYFSAGQAVGLAYGLVLGFANPCLMTGFVQMGFRGLQIMQASSGVLNAAENFQKENYVSAAFDLIGVAGNFSSLMRACFTGEMLLDVEGGRKRADAIAMGDMLWAKNEFDPNGPIELKEVEEVFVRVAPILNVHVAGQILRTTAEHPFWVEGKAWLNAGSLQIGDMLTTRDGSLVPVEGVAYSGDVTTVYNWRIADHHTYFVSASADAPAIWAHNQYKVHHIATDKSPTGWTKVFQHIFTGANMNLSSALNKIGLVDHAGGHGIYNLLVYERLLANVVSKYSYGSAAYRTALRIELALMRKELRDSTSTLGSLVRAKAGGVEVKMYGDIGRSIARSMGF